MTNVQIAHKEVFLEAFGCPWLPATKLACLTIASIWMFNDTTLLGAVFTFGEGAASCLTMAFGTLFVAGSVINRIRRFWEGYF